MGPRILAVIAAGLLTLAGVGSASGADGASLRAFSTVPAERFTLLVDGRQRVVAGSLRSVATTPLRPGRHVFAARVGKRIVAHITVRVAPRDALVLLLASNARGGRILRALNAAPTTSGAVRFRIVNLDPLAGPISVTTPPGGLRLVSSLPFGVVSVVRTVPATADPSGVLTLDVADRSGQPFASGRLILAAGSYSLFALVPGPEGSLLVRIPAVATLPEPLTLPTITGTPRVPATVTCGQGTWNGHPTFSYRWSSDGVPIDGATASTLALTTAEDAGHTISCAVIGSNAAGAVTSVAAGAFRLPPAPTNTVPPNLGGQPVDTGVLTCLTGTWTDDPTLTVAWLRDGVVVGGADPTYTLHAGAINDEGHAISCRVMATNAGGSAVAETQSKTLGAPTADPGPLVGSTNVVGSVVSVTPAVWHAADGQVVEPTSRAFQWMDCASGSGAPIDGATSTTYTIALADIGAMLCVRETIIQGTTTTFEDSAAGPTVLPHGPGATIDAIGQVTASSVVVNGTINPNGSPTSWWVDWGTAPLALTSTTPDAPTLDGANGLSISATLGDLAPSTRYFTQIRARNGNPQVTRALSWSFWTAPGSLTPPQITSFTPSTVGVGTSVTCSPGTWTVSPSGVPPTTTSIRWIRTAGGTPVAISTAPTYVLTAADVGPATIACEVTASNQDAISGGRTVITSSNSVSLPNPPSVSAAGATLIGGTSATIGATVDPGGDDTTVTIDWGPTPAYGASATFTAIATVGPQRVESTVSPPVGSGQYHFRVTAVNRSAHVASGDVTFRAAPQVVAAPTIGLPPGRTTADVAVGETVTCNAGTWTAADPSLTMYSWQHNGMGIGTPSAAADHVLDASDAGTSLTCLETVSNVTDGGGASAAPSDNTINLPRPPRAPVPPSGTLPTITGLLVDGEVVMATDGTGWTGGLAPITTYQWQTCDATDVDGSTCQVVGPPASSGALTIDASEVGRRLAVVVVHANRSGSASAAAAPSGPIADALPTAGGSVDLSTATPVDGSTVSAVTAGAAWGAAHNLTFSQSWEACATSACDAPVLLGAGASYTPGAGDVGSFLRYTLTATNSAGAASLAVTSAAAVADVAPVASGSVSLSTLSPVDGQLITSTTGAATWGSADNLVLADSWERCADAGCILATRVATTSTYTAVAADAGSYLRYTLTATNGAGAASLSVTTTTVVANVAPVAGGLVSLDRPTPSDGQLITPTTGAAAWGAAHNLTLTIAWERCGDASCTAPTQVATTATYAATAADVGSYLRYTLTATNTAGSASLSATTTAAVADVAPTAGGSVSLNRPTPRDGQLITPATTLATWGAAHNLTLTHAWERCADASCTAPTQVATTATYTATAADAGSYLRYTLIATNTAGTASLRVTTTAAVTNVAPVAGGSISLDDPTPADGQLITPVTSLATWGAAHNLTLTHAWVACPTSACLTIGSVLSTSATYTAGPADAGSFLRYTLTATNTAGAASLSTTTTAAVTNVAPVAGGSISLDDPTPTDGQLITPATGSATWGAAHNLTLTSVWASCPTSACLTTTGPLSTSATYTAGPADAGSFLRYTLTATNAAGSASLSVTTTAAVTNVAPVAGGSVTLDRPTPTDGQLITPATGSATWGTAHNLTLTHAWVSCPTSACLTTSSVLSTSATYTATATDVAAFLRYTLTATNTAGSASLSVTTTAAVTNVAPIAGGSVTLDRPTPSDGQLITPATGSATWGTAHNLTLTHTWERCSDGACSTPVQLATTTTYTATAADAASYLRYTLTATNAAGSASLSTTTTAAVTNVAPVAGGSVTLDRPTPTDGQLITPATGSATWGTAHNLTLSHAWVSCPTSACLTTSSVLSTSATYTATATDVAAFLRYTLTATNTAGSASLSVTTTAAVTNVAPIAGGSVTLDRPTPMDGQLITPATGSATWGTAHNLTLTHTWERCTDAICTSTTQVATTSTYTATGTDVGSYLRYTLTATNTAANASLTVTTAAAVTNVAPVAGGSVTLDVTAPSDGQLITPATGSATWGTAHNLTLTHAWERCTDATCTSTTQVATTSTYTATAADAGSYLRYTLTATNTAGAASISATTAAAVTNVAPVAGGSVTLDVTAPNDGQLITPATGSATWGTAHNLTLTHTWERCSDAPCTTPTQVATTATYTATAADAGSYLRYTLTATNTAGAASISATTAAAVTNVAPVAGGSVTLDVTAPGDGQLITPATGGATWGTAHNLTLTHAWERCTDATCTSTTQVATTSTYTAVSADVGKYLRYTLTATNDAGSDALSVTTASAVAAAAPVIGVPVVTLDGLGTTASSTDGSPAGTAPITIAYQWQTCVDVTCAAPGAVGSNQATYSVQPADTGLYLQVVIVATGPGGVSAPQASVPILLP